jgi:hypothetical protein
LAQAKRRIIATRKTPLSLLNDEINRIPESHQKELLAKAYDETVRMREPTDQEALEYINSLEGMAFVVWACAKDVDPSIRIEAVIDAIDCMDETTDDMKRFIESVGREIFREDPTKPGPAQKSRARSRKR